MVRFLHAADIHLDSPLKGLERYPGAPVEAIRSAGRRAFERLIDRALTERVDFVLIAGDLYDGDWKDYKTGLFFVVQAGRLKDAGIPLFLIAGNHDAANTMTRKLRFENPDGSNPLLRSDRPETRRLESLRVAVHGRSFPDRSVPENFAADYPPAVPGWFNIGLLHTSLEGNAEHATYAPCLVDDLVAKHYDYWALGHIHLRQVVREKPWIVFPGNLQGRHARETGAKGAYLVETLPEGGATATFVPLDVLRWEVCRVDLSDVADEAELSRETTAAVERVVDANPGLPLALRLRLTGVTPFHETLVSRAEELTEQLRGDIANHRRDRVWVEKIKFETAPPQSPEETAAADALVEELLAAVGQFRDDPAWKSEWGTQLEPLFRKLPPETKREFDPLGEGAAAILADLPTLLTAMLKQDGRRDGPTA